MKRIISAVLILISLFSITAFADEDITIYLNDEIMTFDQPPIIRNDFTLVPFRAIFEALDMTVQWFEDDRRVTAQDDKRTITLNIDSNKMYVNNDIIELLTLPIIYNERTLVPLRAISEAAGAEVSWDGETYSVYIKTEESDFDSWTKQVLALVNNERIKNGLNTLRWDNSLAELAKAHCEDMIARNFFSHNNPDGETPFDRMKKAGISYLAAGENIAAGQYSPEAVFKEWMASEGHRENIMKPDFQYIGISAVKGGSYGIYWAQEFAEFNTVK